MNMEASSDSSQNVRLLSILEPVVEKEYKWHMDQNVHWYPHLYLPDSLEPGTYNESVRSAWYVNNLTEENLPHYHEEIISVVGRNAWIGRWVNRWTYEEGRHGYLMTEYTHRKTVIDPVLLEDGRRVQIEQGNVPHYANVLDLFAYTMFQEPATHIAHSNTGRMMKGDADAPRLLTRVGRDETYHYIFYRDMVRALLEITPSDMVTAIGRQVVGFAMPGVGIPGFEEHSKVIADAGIFNKDILVKDVFKPVLRTLHLERLEGLSREARLARSIVHRIAGLPAAA